MKRLITILISLTLAIALAGQGGNTYKYPITIGSVGGTAGKITLKGSTSGETVFQSSATGTTTVTGTIALPTTTSIGDVSATEIGYVNNVTSAIQTQINEKETRIDSLVSVLSDTIDNATVFPELLDTIPLVTFGAGSGLIADTALFNNNVLIGSFYNEGSDTLVITQLMGILKEGTGTETIAVQISWHATFLSGSATNLNSSALTVNSLTTGTEDVSFANAKIPPNVFVWGILSGASKDNKPTFLNVTLSGYKIPKY